MLEMRNIQKGVELIAEAIGPMRNNRIRNYIVPGLTSHLIGGGEHGKVRLFQAERNTRDVITPHSHRFDFACLVLAGHVRNTIYDETINGDEEWCVSTIDQVCGANGLLEFVHTRESTFQRFRRLVSEYKPGDTYAMSYEEVHSIEFSAGAKVLFFEGPQIVTRSKMIEPWCDGKVVPTFKTEDWMFLRDEADRT